ncbi:hypothetical protein HYPSUDRAFT_193151 [Hypholoma sublateritium FD-334 SS-4]|uniref:Methyltransferase-domain-containing protein n=1 Tax=Hypholoma sublateritium (strain FD-334 SS-4) TaxID=945553 RepID=A0A0D2KP84_HYPSF|nr:hypothetical protein HYPSUDRAFT_193151 [Hypholoma sublateritium FD-334 SS-4]
MVTENNGGSSYNPNFPLHLNIHPSTIPTAHSATFADAATLDAQFGCAAQEASILQYGIAGRVWEASYAMILYIQPPQNIEFDPPFINTDRTCTSTKYSMLELGSGTGLVASTLLKLLDPARDHIIVTDLPEVCPLLEANLRPVSLHADVSRSSAVTIMPLSWGNYYDVLNLPKLTSLTHIICSDLVYFPDLMGPLLRSLLHLSSPPFSTPSAAYAGQGNPTVIISYKLRSLVKETSFWSAFGLWFAFVPVVAREISENGEWTRFGSDSDDTTFIFVAHRRPESFDWNIPLLDEQLLAGTGAHGTDSPKGDDTFETLLFMALDQ